MPIHGKSFQVTNNNMLSTPGHRPQRTPHVLNTLGHRPQRTHHVLSTLGHRPQSPFHVLSTLGQTTEYTSCVESLGQTT